MYKATRRSFLVAAILALGAGQSSAALVLDGIFPGPGGNFSIDMTLTNAATSTTDLVSFSLDGSTAYAFPILWDDAGTPVDPPGATSTIVGVDTQVLGVSFADSPNGFNPGEAFSLLLMDPDGDPGPAGVSIGEMAGITLTALGRDGSIFTGVFVLDAQENLVLRQSVVPEPASVLTALVGALIPAGLAWRRGKSA